MANQDTVKALIKQISGQANTLSVPVLYLKMLDGDVTTALLLSQLVYWSDRGKDGKWIYKSYRQWKEELCLSQFQVKRAADKLVKLGVLKTERRLAPAEKKTEDEKRRYAPTMYYQVDLDKLTETIIKFLHNGETSQSEDEVSQQSEDEVSSQSLITETTTENKTENIGALSCAHVSSLDDLEEPKDHQPSKASTPRRKPRRSEKPIVGDIENLPPSHKPLAAAFVAGCARANIDAKAFLQTSGDLTLWRKSIGEWMQRKFTPDIIEQAVIKQAKMGWNIFGPQSITTCAKGVMAEAPAVSSGAWHAGDPL